MYLSILQNNDKLTFWNCDIGSTIIFDVIIVIFVSFFKVWFLHTHEHFR